MPNPFGRPSVAKLKPEVASIARKLRADGRTLGEIMVELTGLGHLTKAGKPYSLSVIRHMLGAR